MPDAQPSPIARALGRIPTGLYIVSTESEGAPLGFVGSFLMQVGFDPPTVCVAIGKGRAHLDAIRRSGRFGVSVLDGPGQGVMGRFFKQLPEGQTPFDGLELVHGAGGTPVLADSLAWLECELRGEHDAGDHVVVFGVVTDAAQVREGEPAVHLRKDGLGY